jgi:cell shape-determining protein MreC
MNAGLGISGFDFLSEISNYFALWATIVVSLVVVLGFWLLFCYLKSKLVRSQTIDLLTEIKNSYIQISENLAKLSECQSEKRLLTCELDECNRKLDAVGKEVRLLKEENERLKKVV